MGKQLMVTPDPDEVARLAEKARALLGTGRLTRLVRTARTPVSRTILESEISFLVNYCPQGIKEALETPEAHR